MDNNISFKSRIQFVDYKSFKKIICNNCNFIDYKSAERNIVTGSDFYTTNIRTCTGGSLVNATKDSSRPFQSTLGFHIFNNRDNNQNILKRIENALNFTPKNGILIGGKKLYDRGGQYSLPNFDKLKTFMGSILPDFSFFQQQRYLYGQTHFHYSFKDDTWTLCSEFNGKNNIRGPITKGVSCLSDLTKHFLKIHIAQQDQLFIGNKQIFKNDVPSLFIK